MASLAETTRATYAAIETGRRLITDYSRLCLSQNLGWAADWINGQTDTKFTTNGLLFIELAATRILAATQNIIDRRRNDAARATEELLPLFIKLIQPSEVSFWSFGNGVNCLLYISVDSEFMIFKSAQHPGMTDAIKSGLKVCGIKPEKRSDAIEAHFYAITSDEPESIKTFLKTVSKSGEAAVTLQLPKSSLTSPTAQFDQAVRESILHRICHEMESYAITLNDIREYQARQESDGGASH